MTDNLLVAKVLLLASSWLNISLYTLELVLARRYFQRPNRPLPYQIAVGTLVFFDTVCTFTICVNACFVVLAIPLDGNPATLLAPTSIIIFMTHFSAAIEQTILCHLFFSLTGKMLISAGLALLILVQTGAAFASGGLILALNSEVTAALTASTVASVTCAAADIFIAICLSVKVWKMLSPADVITSSDSLVRKFFLLVVSSGLIVASNTLITMGLVLKLSLPPFFFTWQGRVYSLTLLANFLLGVHFRRDTDTDTSTETHGAQCWDSNDAPGPSSAAPCEIRAL
ncbi:hypothetical protein DFH09DRAFT_1175454, partial [Mycena vulgaris]